MLEKFQQIESVMRKMEKPDTALRSIVADIIRLPCVQQGNMISRAGFGPYWLPILDHSIQEIRESKEGYEVTLGKVLDVTYQRVRTFSDPTINLDGDRHIREETVKVIKKSIEKMKRDIVDNKVEGLTLDKRY